MGKRGFGTQRFKLSTVISGVQSTDKKIMFDKEILVNQ